VPEEVGGIRQKRLKSPVAYSIFIKIGAAFSVRPKQWFGFAPRNLPA
jgi:hypothetical protein